MWLAVVLLLQTDEASLREAEAKRIASKPSLTEDQQRNYERPAPDKLKPVRGYNLAVLPLAFSDEAAPAPRLLDDLRGWYAKASGGAFDLAGKSYGGVPLPSARKEFGALAIRSGEERDHLLRAVDAWRKRDGDGVLAAHDGIALVPPGKIGAKNTALWPHQGMLEVGGVEVPYVLIPFEASSEIAAHEFGHLLGLEDKYHVGRWCLMGTGYNNHAPLCAACRWKLGWAKVATVDPRFERKVAIDDVLRVLLTADGSEALFLEVRPEGLLIWHVGGGVPTDVLGPFPSKQSDRLTPFSDPPLIGRGAGARETWLTDLRPGFVVVGPSAPLTPLEEHRRKSIGKTLGK